MKLTVLPKAAIAAHTADLLAEQLALKPDSVLGLATGSTPLPFYEECVQRFARGELRVDRITTFNLDEYAGLADGHPQSYRSFMKKHLFASIGLRDDQSWIPNGAADDLHAECRRYDARIAQSGGIDWQLLGIGHNGHIGFNEPGQALQANTHVVALSEATRSANARFFRSLDEVPKQAITMGMGQILKAKRIVLLATGADKAEIVGKALTGSITTDIPASFLQLHNDLVVVLDEEAGRCL